MGESLEQMFRVFNVKSEDQQYQLDVIDKVKETFQLKLEMKTFENNEKVIDNFRRQGHVPGGGCVKFYRKYLIFTFLPWFSRRSSVPPNKNGAFHILVQKPIIL